MTAQRDSVVNEYYNYEDLVRGARVTLTKDDTVRYVYNHNYGTTGQYFTILYASAYLYSI